MKPSVGEIFFLLFFVFACLQKVKVYVLGSSVTLSTNTSSWFQQPLTGLSDVWAQTLNTRLKVKILFLRGFTFN